MRPKLIFALLIILSFSVIASGQEAAGEKLANNPAPENVMWEVVRRILIYKFRAAKKRRVIYLVREGIDQAWLPVIPNIEFRLLSAEELEARDDGGVYFFSQPQASKNTFIINFAFGDPDCDYSGESWKFRISQNKVRLRLIGGIGGGCSGGSGEFKTAGRLNAYPNELEGYKFFDQGKLKNLKLSLSTREDVRKNFDSACENGCDYDANWKIYIAYFGTLSFATTINGKTTKYIPKAEFIGNIYSLRLIPKQPVSFSRVKFPSRFNILDGFSVGDGFNSEGRLTSAAGTSSKTYIDRDGLKYELYESGYTVGNAEKDTRRKDSLIAIEYSIPELIEKTMFVEQPSILK